jgi:hypothetical protein
VQAYVLNGIGRASKNELAHLLAIIDFVTDMIPYLWLLLPFIDEARRGAFQKKAWIRLHDDGNGRVGIDTDFAFCNLSGSLGLSAGFRASDKNRS